MLNMKRKRAFTDLGDQRGFFSFDPGGCTSGLINTTRMNAKTCGAVPMVRIHLPPVDSPCLAGYSPPTSKSRAFLAGVRGGAGSAVGRDGRGAVIWRRRAAISL